MAALRCFHGNYADPVTWTHRCDPDSADVNLHISATGSVSTKQPGDGDVDLSEEEMEQSVFGQESTLFQP